MNVNRFLKIFRFKPSISTDTRLLKEGDIFFALKGENFNGNIYVKDALNKGASYAVTEDNRWKGRENVIVVEDVLDYLQKVARAYRESLRCKVIAITGTNGKTTTKELCYSVLNTLYRTHATKGNLNNHIGVPLTILSAPTNIDLMIVEMGANHIGEIDTLCHIADPDIGLITNIGKAHLEGFGSLEGVITAKTELYKYLIERKRTIIYNAQDEILKNNIPIEYRHKLKYLDADVIAIHPFIELLVEGNNYTSTLFGTYNVTNILCAITLAKYFDVPVNKIQQSLKDYTSNNNRSEIRNYLGATVVMDAYNANPTSMEASLASFAEGEGGRKIVVLGDMLELGEFSHDEHQNIYDLACKLGFEEIILIGKEFSKIDNTCKTFKSVLEAKPYFDTLNFSDLIILIKGSRGIKLERLIEGP